MRYLKSSEVDAERAVSLLRAAFPFSTHADEAANALLGSRQIDFDISAVEVEVDQDLVAVALAKRVKIQLDGVEVNALTVGPVAVDPAFQGRGVGRLLMGGVDELARSLPVEATYLQGIPNFYHRFGYVPMLSKSKCRIELKSVGDYPGRVNIRPALFSDIPAISAIYSQLTRGLSGAACRDHRDWRWLLGPAARSWYFQNPQIVEVNGEVVGYFCVDRCAPERVREAVYRVDEASIFAFIFGLKTHLRVSGISHAELMTWRSSPLYQKILFRMTSQFVESSSASGGQLIKLRAPAAIVQSILSARSPELKDAFRINFFEDAICISFGPEKVLVKLRSLMVWLLGVMSFEELLKRGDISLISGAHRLLSPEFSRVLRSRSEAVFVFQGDNL